MHLQEMNDVDRVPLKTNEKAACQASPSRAVSVSEMGCCLWGNDSVSENDIKTS